MNCLGERVLNEVVLFSVLAVRGAAAAVPGTCQPRVIARGRRGPHLLLPRAAHGHISQLQVPRATSASATLR